MSTDAEGRTTRMQIDAHLASSRQLLSYADRATESRMAEAQLYDRMAEAQLYGVLACANALTAIATVLARGVIFSRDADRI